MNPNWRIPINTAALLSYNSIPGFTAGWRTNAGQKILVIPNSKGRKVASESAREPRRNMLVRNEIETLWARLDESISEVDHVVVYVGSHGSEHAIKLASKLDTHKVTYVMCTCNLGNKQRMIAAAGHENARLIMCECGGAETMSRLCENFLLNGEIG